MCLLKLIEDKESHIRSNVATALGRLGSATSEVVSGLRYLLGDEEFTVRSSALSALHKLGEVINVAGMKDAEERDDLIWDNEHIASVTTLLEVDLLSSLNNEDSGIRYVASAALGKLGNINSEIVNGLIPLLGDRDIAVRNVTASALSKLAKTSAVILPEVVQWLKQHQNNDGVGSAIDCLWSFA